MKKTKIETFLPCFPGFYETIFQFNDDNVLYSINQDRKDAGLTETNWDSLDVDYKSFELDTIKELCNIISNELRGYVYNIELQKINNPKEYNFKNDSADVIIEPNIDKIQKFIYDNIDAFKVYLKNHYTSRSGFISHYDNDIEAWIGYTDNFTNYTRSGHYLGAILEFIAQTLKIDQENIYYQLQDVIYENDYILNYGVLINNPACSKCDNIIIDDDILKSFNKYKDIQGIAPKTCLCRSCLEKIYA